MVTRLGLNLILLSYLGIAAASCSSSNDAPAGKTPIASDVVGCDGSMSAGAPTHDPVPTIAKGPALTSAGYLVQEVTNKLYWLTDGIYSCMFLSTSSGVIVVDVSRSHRTSLRRSRA
jgi:hypothetical protein